ncbi:hypothetical protein BGZ68_010443 [Mortierella alpina]|nr:hypothetical protein BGZ68_010443 [Mortierella alpina]
MSSTKLYIGNLNSQTDDRSLRTRFEEFGDVEDAVVERNRETGNSRGFGYVVFATDEDAQAAIESLHNHEFEDRTITVERIKVAS